MERKAPETDGQGQKIPLSQLMLHSLTPEQVEMIDRALSEVGPFGEVRLVKLKGKLRFIQKLESSEALPEEPSL